MQEIYRFIDDAIEADRQRYTDIADQIWDHPETRFEEFWSAEHLASALESAGFTVTRNVGNIPNAFIASFGQGKPVIALLGEYDALAGLSQQAGCAQPTSVTPGENGHGCGHNLLGTAAFAAAIAVKLCRCNSRQEMAGTIWARRHGALLWLSWRRRRLG